MRAPGGSDAEPTRLGPLHGGRHSIPAEVVAHNQRERLLGALAETIAQRGYNATTVGEITATAQVSRRTFYENFEDKEECFLAAYDALDEYIASLMAERAEGGEWSARVAATFAGLIEFFASRPNFARLYLVEAAAVGEAMSSRRSRTTDRFVALLEPGREHRGRDRELAEGIEEAIVGGIFTLLGRQILAGEAERLADFIPAVVEFALSPYLGFEEARRAAVAPSA